ncbi:MAG: IPT/TIG domain-containing protein [Myxococcota bacterium]
MRLIAILVALFAACGGDGAGGAPEDMDAGAVAIEPDAAEREERDPTVLSVGSVDPDHGPFTGGTEVVVRGTAFEAGAVVSIGGRVVEPAFQELIDPTRIRVVAPPGEPGPSDVEVAQGDTRARAEDAFTYDAFTVDPARGSIVGGTFVTIVGQGTAWGEDTEVTIGGAALRDLEVRSASEIAGITPAGDAGFADVVVSASAGEHEARDAFEYFDSVDPVWGGLGGEALDAVGALQVTVRDFVTGLPIPGAFVIVGDDSDTEFQGLADDAGEITFVGDIALPASVTAAADAYVTGSIEAFDVTEAVVLLIPIVPPMPGGGGGGILAGRVSGVMQFGGPTGAGSTDWTLVPEPGPGQYLCAHADTSQYHHFAPNPDPGDDAWMFFDEDGGVTAWGFDLYPVRIGTMAVYALAGLCEDVVDDEGNPGPVMVAGYVMGIQRGVVVGPGESVDVDLVMDIPLIHTIDVTWVDPPPMGFAGPDTYTLDVALDLGGDGVIVRRDSRRALDPSDLTVSVPRQASLSGASLFDASYLFVASVATTAFGALATPVDDFAGVGNPFSVVIRRGVTDFEGGVIIDGFLGIPEPVDPTFGGTIVDRRLAFANPGAPSSINQSVLIDEAGALAWWSIIEGGVTEYTVPDLVEAGGFAPMPPQLLTWVVWESHLPSYDFDTFNYSQVLREVLWDAYAADAFLIFWP